MRRTALIGGVLWALAVGCGNDTEETPDNDVDLAAARVDISFYCLEKTEGERPNKAELDAAVDDLVRVYRVDPNASYENQQGDARPAREVLEDSATDLHDCGEHELAGELERALAAGP
jgi:hypothetical protein